MLFMVIERFRDNDMVPIYERVRDSGRMLPEGLKYIETDDPSGIEAYWHRRFEQKRVRDTEFFNLDAIDRYRSV